MIAMMVPMGMEAWGSAKSPDRLDPAMIPVQDGKKMPTKRTKLMVLSGMVTNAILSYGHFSQSAR